MSIDGKTKNLMHICEHFYYPNTTWPKLTQSFLKLPKKYDFDLATLQKEAEVFIKNDLLKPLAISSDHKKKMRSYRGLGLTTKPNSLDPIYDAFSMYDDDGQFSSSSIFENENSEIQNRSPELELKHRNFTEKNQYFSSFIEQILKPFISTFGKVRLMQLMPGGRLAPHVDFPYYDEIRIHACISSNEDSWWEVDGKKFQIPADGSFYWYDTGRPHAVWNDGNTPRLILSIHLSPFFNHQGQQVLPATEDLIKLIQSGRI